MTLPEEDLFSLLTSIAGITMLAGTRITPMVLPENWAGDAITYQRVSTPKKYYVFRRDTGNEQIRYQLNCWSKTYTGAKRLAAAVKTGISGYGGTYAKCVQITGERDANEPELGIYRVILEILFFHKG